MFELDADQEDRLGDCCYPPGFRGNFTVSREKMVVTGLDPVTQLFEKCLLVKMDGYAGQARV